VGHDGLRGGRAARRPRRRASLAVRLAATALCLLAAGAAIITGARGQVARGYLQGQADRQLRADAGRLLSHPLTASPLYGVAPGVPGAPGFGDGPSIELREPGGQVVMRASAAGRSGPAIPAVPAAVVARAGQPATVAAGGGSWRVITEPIHYRARRIPYSYSTEGFYVVITSTARQGLAGTLVIGLDLRGAGGAPGRLAGAGLAISGVAILAATCLAFAVSRALLRPVTRAGRAPEAAADGPCGQLGGIIADTGDRLRKPLSIIRGVAGSYRRGGQFSPAELDRMMRRVAGEAARLDALLDELLPIEGDPPPGQR
jgi:two-component system OmpR family sensor kinase